MSKSASLNLVALRAGIQDCLCRCGAPVKNLAHSASFESLDKNAPSKVGTKHLIDPRTASNDAEACEDDPILASFFNSQYTSRSRDEITRRDLLRTIATVDDCNAVPYILDAIILEQRARAIRACVQLTRERIGIGCGTLCVSDRWELPNQQMSNSWMVGLRRG